MSDDHMILFSVEQSGKRSLNMDIKDYVLWLDNLACQTKA